MKPIATYYEQHAELMEMIDELRPLLTMDKLSIGPVAKTAHGMLCELGKKVKAHLADEDQSLYPELLVHEDPKVKSMAWGFISGEKPLRRWFKDYNDKWLKDCDFEFTEEFLEETNEVIALLIDRVTREDKDTVSKTGSGGIAILSPPANGGGDPLRS